MAQSSARAVAVAALTEWRSGHRFADSILQELLAVSHLGSSDKAFATELFYGVLRNLTLLDFWIGQLRSASIDAVSRDLLRLGLYQLFVLRTPGHAAVFETVTLASSRRRSLINAVLRAALRKAGELDAAAEEAPLSIRKSHPEFLLERWTQSFGQDAAAGLCEWNNKPAPSYARINRLKIPPEQLSREQTSASGAEDFVRLDEVPLEALARGECYIQDPSTRVACELLNPQPGEAVLDACAAPGGKTGLIAQLMANKGSLFACDRDSSRLQVLRENLDRLGIENATVVRQDWRKDSLASEFRERQFDRILVDAPCTNTGVMRRRVDVRWRLRSDDFARMQKEQLAILRAIVVLLKPDGVLVYSTCSLEAEENEQVVHHFLEEFSDFRLEEQRSVFPLRAGFDGAFAALLRRNG